MRRNASSHLFSGILLSSITVPTVTVNARRQGAHWTTPGRVEAPPARFTRSVSPQRGQTGPFGQWRVSRCSRAKSALEKIGSVSENIGSPFVGTFMRPSDVFRQVYNCQNLYWSQYVTALCPYQ